MPAASVGQGKATGENILGGYRKCIEHVIRKTGLDIDGLLKSELPVKVSPDIMTEFVPRGHLDHGCATKTGKLELYSELVADCGESYEPACVRVCPTRALLCVPEEEYESKRPVSSLRASNKR